jgi:hypothetical protein
MKRVVFAITALLVSTATWATECGSNFAACAATAERVGPNGVLPDGGTGWDVGWVDGFVMGVGLSFIQAAWCPRQPISNQQLSAIVSKYMRENPAEWGEQPKTLVLRALSQAFPCKR